MDKVYEAIERIPEQFRYVVIIAVSVVVALLYWFLMRMPQQDELVRQEAMYQEVHRDLTEKKKSPTIFSSGNLKCSGSRASSTRR